MLKPSKKISHGFFSVSPPPLSPLSSSCLVTAFVCTHCSPYNLFAPFFLTKNEEKIQKEGIDGRFWFEYEFEYEYEYISLRACPPYLVRLCFLFLFLLVAFFLYHAIWPYAQRNVVFVCINR